MKGNLNRTLSQNDATNDKENIHKKNPKVKFNLLDWPNNKDIDLKNKFSVIPLNPKSKNLPRKVNSFYNIIKIKMNPRNYLKN